MKWMALLLILSFYFMLRFTFWLLPWWCGPCLYHALHWWNARRHITWQLLSLALHLSSCEAAASPVWEVKRKHVLALRSEPSVNTYMPIEISHNVVTVYIYTSSRLVKHSNNYKCPSMFGFIVFLINHHKGQTITKSILPLTNVSHHTLFSQRKRWPYMFFVEKLKVEKF